MKPSPYWARSFSSEPEPERLLMLHRVTDMDAEDELAMGSLELLGYAVCIVGAIAASVFYPWGFA
jgi:hypothetical protein